MASNTMNFEIIASELNEPISIQFDEKSQVLYVLNNWQLIRIDLNNKNQQIVRQHNRKFQKTETNDDDDDEYSQGESDDEHDNKRVLDPFDDSEPSTDDDDEKIENRRNWRRYGWRTYELDNPCSILFLSEKDQLIVLNEGVITFIKIHMENNFPFVEGKSINIFCYDFDVFKLENHHGIQPWSIISTSKNNFFLFSLLQGSSIYSLDMENQVNKIDIFTKISFGYCPYLLFHQQLNQIFVYNSKEIFVISFDDKIQTKLNLTFIEEENSISSISIDKQGFIYILSNSMIFKCIYSLNSSQFHLIQCLAKINLLNNAIQMIVTDKGDQLFFSDSQSKSIYQSNIGN